MKAGGQARPTHRRPASTPRAREFADTEIEAAGDYDTRSLLCFHVLLAGQWQAMTPRLKRTWGTTDAALSNYRRAGRVAQLAMASEDVAKTFDHVVASLQHLADHHEEQAIHFESRNRPSLARSHLEDQRRAIMDLAEVMGLRQKHVSVSVEADPRIAGAMQAILAALADRDRQETERAARVSAWIVEVEKLTGGVLPPGLPEALPSARDHVRDAVKRYEAEIGARTLAA